MSIKRAKAVSSQKNNRDGMSPIVWWAKTSGEQQVSYHTTYINDDIIHDYCIMGQPLAVILV